MNIRHTRLLLLACVLGITLSAQTKPDFTGLWKLNVSKSDLGGAPIAELVVQVDHKDPVFKYTAKGSAGGEAFEETETILTDGNPTQDSRGATVTAHWDGPTLVFESTGADGNALDASRLRLSTDRKTITRDYERKSADEPQKRHEIFEKQ
jgi:hypothetical protein